MARAVRCVGLRYHLLVLRLALLKQCFALLQHALLLDLLILKAPGLAGSVRRLVHKLVERVAGSYRRSPAIDTRANDLTRRRWFVGLDYMVQWIEGATVRVSVTVVFRVLQHDVRLYRSRRQRIVGKRERAPRLVSLRLGGGIGGVLVEDTGTFRSGVLALLLSHGEATQSFVDLLIVICHVLCNRFVDVNDLNQVNKTIYLNKMF